MCKSCECESNIHEANQAKMARMAFIKTIVSVKVSSDLLISMKKLCDSSIYSIEIHCELFEILGIVSMFSAILFSTIIKQ